MEVSMKNLPPYTGASWYAEMANIPIAAVQIDQQANILHCNKRAEALLQSFNTQGLLTTGAIFTWLFQDSPDLHNSLINYKSESGMVGENKIKKVECNSDGLLVERYLRYSIYKCSSGVFMLHFNDVTLEFTKDAKLQELINERALFQERFDVTADVLHDIGNGIVGLGSYLNRFKRSIESDNTANLLNLVDFFTTHAEALTTAIGEKKSQAVIKVLNGIAQTQQLAQEDLSKSVAEQQHLVSHIQEILNVHKHHNLIGGEPNAKKMVSVAGIILNCTSMLQATFRKKDIYVELDIPARTPNIIGDHTRLMQVMMNVLKNATEAIEVYAVEKTITVKMECEEGYLNIEIKDSGSGFEAETAAQLFQRGFTTKSSGSGLGLSSCRAIIDEHGGTINITSEGIGKGATTLIKFKV